MEKKEKGEGERKKYNCYIMILKHKVI